MRLQPLFYKIVLAERTYRHIFLAPTKIKFSNYNWVKASTFTCKGSNLYIEDNMFFLAPPYHPCFSYLNMFSTICRKTHIIIHTNYVLIYLWIFLCTLVPLIVSILDILARTQSPLSLFNPHFNNDPWTISMLAESTHITSSHTSSYTNQSVIHLLICMPDC